MSHQNQISSKIFHQHVKEENHKKLLFFMCECIYAMIRLYIISSLKFQFYKSYFFLQIIHLQNSKQKSHN